MIQISRTGIRNLASNDTVYARGLQYYKDNRIVSATYSNAAKQYRMIVKGNYNYSVTVDELEDSSFDYNCNCPSRLKDQGACKHVVASLLFILKYQEKTLMSESKSPVERKVINVIDYFLSQEDTSMIGETFSLDLFINIPNIFKNDRVRAYLSLHGGNNRKYKIQTIRKFLANIYDNENFVIGKEFKYIHGESSFDSTSQAILDYLLGLYEIQEIIDSTHFSKMFSKSEVTITKNMLIKLLDIVGESTFTLALYGKVYENVRFLRENPKVSYKLTLDEETVIIDYNSPDVVIPISESGELFFFEGDIYLPNEKFIRNFKPFYNSLGKNKAPLTFNGENRNKFLEHVLPRISETMDLEVPEELKSRYIYCDMESKIYMDKYKNGIKAELRFKYGEYEFNSFENASAGSYIVVRQREKEDEIVSRLLSMGFVPFKNFFLLKDENKIFEFLSERIGDLGDETHLFYSEDFRRLGVHMPGNFKAGVRLNAGLNMLELDISFDEVPKDELRDLFHSFRIKKKYYRLKDGSFIMLNDEKLDEVSRIMESLNADKESNENNAFLIKKQHAVYLEKSFSDKDFEFYYDQDFKALTDKILNPSTSDFHLPNGILAELRPYQIIGYKWLKTLAENGLGGILADDMGLGKTIQSIVYMASGLEDTSLDPADRQVKDHYLVVCPTSLIYNWQDEIESFAPFLKTAVITGPPADREEIIKDYKNYDVLITSYPLIRRDIAIYEKITFHTVFIDEAQFIKNNASLNSKSVKRIKANNRFALTGTPIENSLSELWSIFDFIMPGYLNSHSKFVEVYEKPILKEDANALEDLHMHIEPFILRRMKKDVLTELPDKYETKMLTDLSEEQKKVYLAYLENIRSEINSEINENGVEKSRMKILAALTRLRQICCHPSTFIDNYQGGSGKLDLLMEVLADAIANEHRILVFSQFTSMLKIIEEELKDLEIDYFYIEGNTHTSDRNDYVKRFNSGEGKVFLISLKAGGTGLNLTGADTVIHYDPWWNPAVEDQATDRAYRIGQQNKVHVMKLITKGTIEEKIYKFQKKKKELSDTIISSKQVFINNLSREELDELFTPIV